MEGTTTPKENEMGKYVIHTFDGKMFVVAAPTAKIAVAFVEAKGLAAMKVYAASKYATPMYTVA